MSAQFLTAAEIADPVKAVDGVDGELGVTADALTADVIEKVNAGAQLAYALYHRDPQWWRDQPHSVCAAYVRVQRAYGIGDS